MTTNSLSLAGILSIYVSEFGIGDDIDAISDIDVALRGGGIPSDHIEVLTFAKSLLQYANNNWKTCIWLVKLIRGRPISENLAHLLFPRSRFDILKMESPPNLDALNRIRVGFFQAKPLLAVKLVLKETEQFPLAEITKNDALRILDTENNQGLETESSTVFLDTQYPIPGDGGYFPDPDRPHPKPAIIFARKLKGLCRVAQDPEDVLLLYRENLHTIRSIATERRERFTNKFVTLGMTRDSALAIYNTAQRIDCWNEHFWLTMMEAHRKDFIPVRPQTAADGAGVGNGGEALCNNNLTDIFQLEENACETCCSITSLSAYFADLMSLLKHTNSKISSASLFHILDKRRPDLKHLQLTCANSQTLIPYISLVNEVLESYIYYQYNMRDPRSSEAVLEEEDSIRVWNIPEDLQTSGEDIHNDHDTYQPGNTIDYVYSDIISQQMYPFAHFPYEKPRDEIRQIMTSFQVPMSELVETFRMRQHILDIIPRGVQIDVDVNKKLQRGINEVFERQSAAEVLGIQQAEFSAIAGETFFPSWFADLLHGLSDKAQPSTFESKCSWQTATLWGYLSTADMVNEKSASRLSLIKHELMKRSDLEFQDVLDLAKSQCFGQDLVIVNKTGSSEFRNSLEDLLLLSSSSNPPFKDLTEEICFNLQAFLRLKAKLKWTTKDLDATIYSLRSREIEQSFPLYKPSAESCFAISPLVVKGIASIVKLSQLTHMDPIALLPLWGTIDTYGPNSFMHRKFFTPSLRHVSKIFEAPKDDTFLTINGTHVLIHDEDVPICMSLQWPVDNYHDLLQITRLNGDGELLDVDKFSALYRHVLICKILQVPPKDSSSFFKLFYANSNNPLESPASTLSAITKWRSLLDAGWTVETLHDLLNGPGDVADTATPPKDGLRAFSLISQGMKGIRNSFPFLFSENGPGYEHVAECAARTFDAATSKVVVEFIEGTQIQTQNVVFADRAELNKAVMAATKWPEQLQLMPDLSVGFAKAELSVVGTLTSKDDKVIEGLSYEPPRLKEAVENIRKRALTPGDLIRSRFEKNSASETTELMDIILGNKESETGRKTGGSEAHFIKHDLLKRERENAFVKLCSTAIIRELVGSLVLNTVVSLVPGIDPSLASSLLLDVVQVPLQGSKRKESAMAALQRLSETDVVENAGSLDAYFTPKSTDMFTLSYQPNSRGLSAIASPELTVNGIIISFDAKTGRWNPFTMASGQTYHFVGNFASSELLWATPKSMSSPFTEEILIPAQKVKATESVISAFKRVACVCQTYKLTAAEVEYFGRPQEEGQRFLPMDFNEPTLDLLDMIQDYVGFKGKCVPRSREYSCVSLFRWLSRTRGLTREETIAEIAASTGWDEVRLNEAVGVRYEGYSDAEVLTSLRDFNELLALQAIMSIDHRLAVAAGQYSQPSMYNLYRIAKCRFNLSLKEDMQVAHDVRAGLTLSHQAASDRVLMENQRKALVAYLLQQDYTKELGIFDADGLFEYFLIDVQMGPELRTSRIKQAISVVQLFAQRSLLGLEKEVSKTSLVREQWEWRQQYSLWEAHVKMFLYPENWLEPSLRDDKSQLFDDLEASLTKKNLSLDTFAEAMKTYVYGLNQIASLEVAAYHIVRKQGAYTDTYHFFGRTRTAPHTFYHRTLTVSETNTTDVFWRPWTKIEIDIPSIETQWEGKRLDITGSYMIPILTGGRLYLFIPQISPKSIEPDNPTTYGTKFGDLSKEEVGVAKPKRVWEITMAWTELSRGSWTPKRVSTGSIMLETSETEPNALGFEPVFETDSSSTKVTIVAGHQHQPQCYRVFGGFSFCEDQMVSLSKDDMSFTMTFALNEHTFQQETRADLERVTPGSPLNHINHQPYYWMPQALADLDKTAEQHRKSSSISWTLSYSREEGPTSLVLSAQRYDGTSVTYFNLPKKAPIPLRSWPETDLTTQMKFVTMDHTFSHDLMCAAATQTNPLSNILDVLTHRIPDLLSETFGQCNVQISNAQDGENLTYHELAKPTALYNWEIGLHSIFLAVDRFFATQQFDEALQVARLVFDPTVNVEYERYATGYRHHRKPRRHGGKFPDDDDYDGMPIPYKKIIKKESCWRFPPFQDIASKIGQKSHTNIKLADIDNDKDFNMAINERQTHGALVHATARGRPEAYMKWIVMKYAEILLAAGDVHFRRGTLESLPLAIQRYIEASHILGPEPPKTPKFGNKKPRTFYDLGKEDIDVELGLPFSPKLEAASGDSDLDLRGEKIVCYLRTTYFCVPLNPKFKQLRSLVNERLFNIRHSLDIHGRPITYALTEPSIDPGALISLSSQGLSMSDALATVLGDQHAPLPRQRFDFLLRQATDLCYELRILGERLLSAVEKKEGEQFAAIRARHATAIQKKTLEIKQTNLMEAQQTIQSLVINRESQVSQLAFYLALIGEPSSVIPGENDQWHDIKQDIDTPTKDDLRMSSFEKMELDLTKAAGALNTVASGIDGIAAPLYAIPLVQANVQPVGVGASISAGGPQIGAAFSAASAIIKMSAMIMKDEADQALRKAQLTKQLQDRRLQANMRGREIKSIDKQIEIQKIRVRAVQKEIELQQSEIEEAAQIESWYRTKYSNDQLYGWMEKSIRNLYYQAYNMAISAARRAESALSFEQGKKAALLRQGGYWDASHDGLLAADNLYLDLKRLQSAYADIHHDFEVTKTVSLRQLDPLALLKLRLNGTTTFSLSENLFDSDFPGHYMRRIRSVAVSVPAIVGPYSNINATLQLTGHRYRVSSTVSKTEDYAAQDRSSFRTDNIPITAVAISSGTNDAGVFELAFTGSKYMPFEGAGAISSWRLDLPEIRKFDYESISDILLHIQYTALDGGIALRSIANEVTHKAASAITKEGRSEGFWAMWDLKYDFINEWHEFQTKLLSAKSSDTPAAPVIMRLGNLKNRLPFQSRQQAELQVHNIIWASRSSSLVTELKVGHEADEQPAVSEPGNEDVIIEPLGKNYTMKTWKNLVEAKNLDGWKLAVPATVLGDGEKTVPNVYMLIRYTYA